MDSETDSKINNVCLVIIAIICVTIALIYTRTILVPFVFALFIYAMISSGTTFIHKKWKIKRSIATLITLFFATIVLTSTVMLIVSSIQNFIGSAHIYNEKFIAFVDWGTDLADQFGFQFDKEYIKNNISNLPILPLLQNISGDLVGFIVNLALITIFTLFMLLGEGKAEKPNKLMHEIKASISKYIIVKLLASIVGGIATAVILLSCGVELAFMFAVLSIFLNFIPNIGSALAILLPLPIIILQFGFGWQFTVVLVLTSAVQFALGSFIEPKFVGESVDLHPITILLFLMFWGLVWGLPGMFLAVPITAALKIIFSRISTTKPLAELLAGRM